MPEAAASLKSGAFWPSFGGASAAKAAAPNRPARAAASERSMSRLLGGMKPRWRDGCYCRPGGSAEQGAAGRPAGTKKVYVNGPTATLHLVRGEGCVSHNP